jgi:hypothetical protein
VGLERQHHGLAAGQRRGGPRLRDQRRMAAVHAVEVPDRDRGRTQRAGERTVPGEDVHRAHGGGP